MRFLPEQWWHRVVAITVLAAVLAAEFFRVDNISHSASDTVINYLPRAIAIVTLWLLVLFVTKTGKVSTITKEEE